MKSFVALILLVFSASAHAAKAGATHALAQAEFLRGPIREIAVVVGEEELDGLRKDPRRYVEAEITIGAQTWKHAAIKLKGADGSFKPVDQKPGLTVSLDKFKGAERLLGFAKFHLNNANEDPTFLRQLICGEMARAASVPAVRCTHAFVTLNGRDLGLYVFTEGFTRDFLAQHFKDATGTLYEGGFCKDIDEALETDLGDEKDRADVEALLAACREEDATKRWPLLSAALDVERFASFLAMEALMAVGDGYDFFRNNYRLYRDPATQRLSFILHGMDQPLNDPDSPIQRAPVSMVGRTFVGSAEGRALYRQRVAQLHESVFQKRDWPARVVEAGEKVRAASAARDAKWAKEFGRRTGELREQVQARVASIAQQLADLPEPLIFDERGVAKLATGWIEEKEGAARCERAKVQGRNALRIVAEGEGTCSWRRALELEPGRYRFEAVARTANVVALRDEKGRAAGLRISGTKTPRANALDGDNAWTPLAYEFETDGGEVILVSELRAAAGEAAFDRASLRLVRLK